MSLPKQPITESAKPQPYCMALIRQSCRHVAGSGFRLDHGRSIVLEQWCSAGFDLRQ
jgi:hypothetical protein